MRGSIDQLGSWAKSELKYWERAALAKIADYTELTDDDINELVRYFVEDAGLAPSHPADHHCPYSMGKPLNLADRHVDLTGFPTYET
ncbi:MAG TPA: hypothetical protein VN933_11810 [Candidatus Eremiobacteraceae bacterium]|nr:hypothetical protein [Candidatus Eremiobacteraceae bacterium]